MAFWDRFKRKPPVGEDTTPPPNEAAASVGEMRNGKKHGRWKERDELPHMTWDSKTFKSVPVDYGWTELDYVDGVKQGPFVEWWGNGKRRRECAYLDGELHGKLRFFAREGDGTVDGTYANGKHTGMWRNIGGDTEYEGEFREGKRQGPWMERYGGVEERGSYIDGLREGPFVITRNTNAFERGSFRANKRDGVWTVSTAEGAAIEEGTYTDGKRTGPWTLRRIDGSIRAHGEYVDGKPVREWTFVDPFGKERGRATVEDEAAIAKWEDFYSAVDLLADYAPTKEWVERVRAAFADLTAAWRVTEKTDKHGQRWLSAPIDAHWQMRISLGVPVEIVCRDECWSKITRLVEELPAEQTTALSDLVVTRCGRYPSVVGRDWLTRIVDGEHDDPRTQIVSRFEPGRELSRVQLERFAERVPHLQEIRLRECTFPDGVALLFERGFPELERLIVVRNEVRDGAYGELVRLLGKATWPAKLEQLAIHDGDALEDADLATLFANPALLGLQYVTLMHARLGPATANALASARALRSLDLEACTLDASSLIALGRHPSLEALTFRRCELPMLTTREARAVGPSPKLKRVVLAGTFDLENYSHAPEAWTSYALARRLAVMPALASVEELDLSHNDLDDLAARVLARSPHLGKLRMLDWTDNGGNLDPLREAFPAVTIQTETRRGQVVVLG
jgi:antitoxin component YwqK of YwqJK toxin-antitoxin module